MAKNFRRFIGRENSAIHLNLKGEFDGTSAYELLQYLQTYRRYVGKIYIHTDHLKHIVPFGKCVLLNNLCILKGVTAHFIFSGAGADDLTEGLEDFRNCFHSGKEIHQAKSC